jgi:hypothetical protein
VPLLARPSIATRCRIARPETFICDLGAMSGDRVLERAAGLPRRRPESAVYGAAADRYTMPNSASSNHAVTAVESILKVPVPAPGVDRDAMPNRVSGNVRRRGDVCIIEVLLHG